jgi:UDP-glucose-4-epimerase GalE
MRVLVTGGAGYIGSVIVARLIARGHSVTALDDLSHGHAAAVAAGARLVVGDVRDERLVHDLLQAEGCEAVVHMAALAEVAESVARPQLYHDVNVGGTAALLEAMRAAGVARIVFSSTAAVYGTPDAVPIDEAAALRPENPYGETKLAAERLLAGAAARDGLGFLALRYFNACGADGPCGEDHDPESHLVPLALRAARDGGELQVYGLDYPTADGTCVRDYVHVADLAEAHIAALERLPSGGGACNLGTGAGASVLEVLAAVETTTGRTLRRRAGARRAGDPPALVASNDLAARLLGWRPRRTLGDAVDDAWAWLREHPRGYDDRDSWRAESAGGAAGGAPEA